ncbi:MAG: hypothetical protein QOC99_1633 [Acidobacteriota bacterium]|jgi:hypothetical protein|nr:hypothetical protein [Acidobacteriota bacterium]MDT7779121.1 hypothetical protein [Acidobacteriota bacterium]
MNTNDFTLDTLESIDDLSATDLFADELEEHYSHAVGVSTLGCISTASCVCICTFSCACTAAVEEVSADGTV